MNATPHLQPPGGLLLSASSCAVIAQDLARELRGVVAYSSPVPAIIESVVGTLPDDPAVLLKAEQVAALLSVSRDAVFDLARRQHDPLPSRKIGRSRRFVRAEVDAWSARQT